MKQESKTDAKRQRRNVFLSVSAIIMIVVGLAYWAFNSAMKAETTVRYAGMHSVITAQLTKTIKGMELSANNMFNEVEKHMDSPESVIAALESESNLNPDVRGYFAAFEPGFFPSKGKWFEPYIHHTDSTKFELSLVGSARHDYTKSGWYVRAKNLKMSFWSEPYYYYDGTNISGHYCTFVEPLFDEQGKLTCVCGADITFDWVSKELARIDDYCRNAPMVNTYRLMRNFDFYSVVLAKDGTCLAHPQDKKIVIDNKELLSSLEQQENGVVEMTIDDVESVVYYGPIEGIDWMLAVIIPKSDLQKPFTYMAWALGLLGLLGIVAVWLVTKRMKDEK